MPYQIVYKNELRHNYGYNVSYRFSYGDELYHYRRGGEIKGRRLYQNLDGSLTPLGRIHYGVGPARTTKALTKIAGNEMKKAAKKVAADRISKIDSDAKSRATEYDSFYKDQADKRKKEEEESAKERFRNDTDARVWEKKVDREPLPEYSKKEEQEESREYIPKEVEQNKSSSNDGAPKLRAITGNYVREDTTSSDKKEKPPVNLKTLSDTVGYGGKLGEKSSSMVGHFEKLAEINYKKGQKSVDLSHLSNEEMRAVIDRINLETRYRDLTSPRMDTSGYEKTKEVLSAVGDLLVIGATGIAIAKGIKDLRKE